jgi:hypothetical protein
MRCFFVVFLGLLGLPTMAQDSLRVYFLHGSKPAKDFKNIEEKWFGGRKGGHVGVEICTNGIVSLVPSGSFHYIGKRNQRHSTFRQDSHESFLEIFGGKAEKMRYTVITIPITTTQSQELCAVQKQYLQQVPYDYAFLGMRCAAASYDMLSKIRIVKPKSRICTIFKIFYPKILRKKLY